VTYVRQGAGSWERGADAFNAYCLLPTYCSLILATVTSVDTKKKGCLIVVSGPSGVGKSTIIERFLKSDTNSRFSVSYTTRQKRDREINGKDYYFVDSRTFQEMVKKGLFLEWENVHNYLYGTPRQEVLDIMQKGIDVILDIDVKGALSVKEKCANAHLIFIAPPSKEELIKRLTLRGEKEIALRMKSTEEEIAQKDQFEYTITNIKLTQAYEDFKKTIERLRRTVYGKNNR
jgi:guanylate kinase